LSVLVDYEEIENTTKGLAFTIMPESLEPDVALTYPEGYPIFPRYKIPLNVMRSNISASLAYAKALDIRLNITFIGSYIQFHRHMTLFTDENVKVYENPNPPPLPQPVVAKGTCISKKVGPQEANQPQPSGSKSGSKTAPAKTDVKENKCAHLIGLRG
jgi:hypothetical protein